MIEFSHLCIVGYFPYKYSDSVLIKSLSFESKIYQHFGILSTARISQLTPGYYSPTKLSPV